MAALREELVDGLVRAGLARPAVTVRRVPELPRDAQTGKLRRFMPLP